MHAVGENRQEEGRYLFSNRDLASLIIPLIIEQFLAVLVGMADTIMVSRVGEAAVSGVSLVDSIMVLLINIFAALATGGAVVAGQFLGQRKNREGCRASEQLVYFVTLLALVIMALCYLCKSLILNVVFGQITPEVKAHADIYLMIVTASIPFIAVYNAGAAVFRSMGNSKISMQVSMIMNAINVCGNALLIYGFSFGTEGVAIPTLVSRVVAAVLIVVLLKKKDLPLHIEHWFSLKFNWMMIKKILYIGIPNGLENSMFQLGKIIVLSLVSTFGTYAITANAVGNVVAQFQVLPGMAMSLAITTVVSQCIGANDFKQVRYYTRKLIKIAYLCMIVMVLATWALMPLILKAYNLSDLTASETEKLMWFHGISCMIIWPIAFALPAVFRAAGDVKFAMLTSVISMWICRIVFSYILGQWMGMGVFGVWVAMILDWCVRAFFFALRYRSGKWERQALV